MHDEINTTKALALARRELARATVRAELLRTRHAGVAIGIAEATPCIEECEARWAAEDASAEAPPMISMRQYTVARGAAIVASMYDHAERAKAYAAQLATELAAADAEVTALGQQVAEHAATLEQLQRERCAVEVNALEQACRARTASQHAITKLDAERLTLAENVTALEQAFYDDERETVWRRLCAARDRLEMHDAMRSNAVKREAGAVNAVSAAEHALTIAVASIDLRAASLPTDSRPRPETRWQESEADSKAYNDARYAAQLARDRVLQGRG